MPAPCWYAGEAGALVSEGRRPSGLRNPTAAVRGVGAGTLAAEGLVLLMALIPLRVLGATGGWGTAAVALLAVASFVGAGLLRRPWAWWAGSALQLVVIASGFFLHGALIAVGVLFGLVWLYVLRVRATVLGRTPAS
jgi:hypothetical protein